MQSLDTAAAAAAMSSDCIGADKRPASNRRLAFRSVRAPIARQKYAARQTFSAAESCDAATSARSAASGRVADSA
jgi:hypothetical protein